MAALLLAISSALLLASIAAGSPAIGVSYHRDIPGLPSGDLVVAALRSAGVRHVRLTNPDPPTVRSFVYSGISLLLSVPHPIAANSSASLRWISDHVLPFHPRARVSAVSVAAGNNLLPAIKNLRSACFELGLRKILISAALPFAALHPAFPPSSARFNGSISIRPVLDFLSSTRSPILIDLFPYYLWRSDDTPVGYATFQQEPFYFRDDKGSGLRYRNLFDEMLDSAISAVRAEEGDDVDVLVGTGWPSSGKPEYGRRYVDGLVEHLRSGLGTPMKRDAAMAVYVWELFDDPRDGNWGIWWANLSSKYDIVFSRGSVADKVDLKLVTAFVCFCILALLLLS